MVARLTPDSIARAIRTPSSRSAILDLIDTIDELEDVLHKSNTTKKQGNFLQSINSLRANLRSTATTTHEHSYKKTHEIISLVDNIYTDFEFIGPNLSDECFFLTARVLDLLGLREFLHPLLNSRSPYNQNSSNKKVTRNSKRSGTSKEIKPPDQINSIEIDAPNFANYPPSRLGKKGFVIYFEETLFRKLKRLAADNETSLQKYLTSILETHAFKKNSISKSALKHKGHG